VVADQAEFPGPLRRGAVPTLLAAGAVGVIIALAGGLLPH
jgi:hypothetical protein